MPHIQVLAAFLFLCTTVSAKDSTVICQNGGVLNKEINRCDCPAEFIGKRCDKACPCQNGGKCIDSYGRCKCPYGFTGRRCETRCPCENGGNCIGSSTRCKCPLGYLGNRCQTKCPCKNLGLCKGQTTECNCLNGYVGKFCQMKCPCQNGGSCIRKTTECNCKYQFYGKQCEIPCPCKNGGRCVSLSLIESSCRTLPNGLRHCPDYNVKCKCKINWTGPLCQQSKCQCQNGGTCVRGRLCVCPPGFAGKKCEIKIKCCNIWGDPHLMTFDGARMDFQGSCRYNLVSFCPCVTLPVGVRSFSVQLKNWRKGKDVKVSWAKRLDVFIDGNMVTLDQKKAVYVRGVKKTLPKKIKGARITKSGKFVRVDTDFGASVAYDGKTRAVVCVPESWGGQLCGICGNNDGNRDNDFITRQGTDLKMTKDRKARNLAVANSWRVMDMEGEICSDTIVPELPPQPIKSWEEKSKTRQYCGLITDKNGPFAACLAKMPPVKIIEFSRACLFDVAEMAPVETEAKAMACSSLEAFATECEELHVPGADTWREITGCKLQCPAGMTYKTKMSACPATCANPNATETCTKPDTEGCACPEGTLMSGDMCVAPTGCGCTDEAGDYYQPREIYMSDDCKDKYVCQPGNQTRSSFIEKLPGCTKHETCKVVDGVETCVPIPVNGEWSEWGEWSTCTKVCGHEGLVQIRVRACDNPRPKHGGSCFGKAYEVQQCLIELPETNACSWVHYPKEFIGKNNIRELKVSSVDECKALCVKEKGCQSIDYSTTWNQCYLSEMNYEVAVAGDWIRKDDDYNLYVYKC